MSDFRSALEASGLHPRDIVADGRWVRCATADKPRKRNGAYKLELGGEVGFWRNWATDSEVNVWGGKTSKPINPMLLQRQRDEARAKRKAGIRDAKALWSAGQQFRGHKYLTAKGLSAAGCHALRVWAGEVWVDDETSPSGFTKRSDEWLLAPLYWRDSLINVQRISTNGIKRQVKGAPQKAASLVLWRPHWALTVFAEGLATGLAVYQSVPHARVVVCYYADNLMPVIDEMRPTGSVVIAADNDHGTAAKGTFKGGLNPGIEKAKNAAALIDCGVVWPDGISGTDFADALIEWGERGRKRVERIITGGAAYVAARSAVP